MTRNILLILLYILTCSVSAQHIQNHQLDGSMNRGLGSGESFNPFRGKSKDSTKVDIKVPKEIKQWRIEEEMGDPIGIDADTAQHMFQNWHLTEGTRGEYNFLGSMGNPRQSRIFFDRPTDTKFDFLQPYDYFYTYPKRFIFTDTKSPYTNLSYHSSGDKVEGDDRVRVYFTTNAGKKFGVGFLFDYLYGRGRYDNQSSALMNFTLFSFYRSDRYNYHLIASRYHMKQAENGGITDDRYITRPEETDGSNSNFGTADIPVKLDKAWNRNEVYNVYFSHNYNMGFYRDEAVKDSNGIATDTLERKFIKVSRITHTLKMTRDMREFINHQQPANYYADTFLFNDSVDHTTSTTIENKVALSLCKGFSRWAFADITAFASYSYNNYTLPDTISGKRDEFKRKYNEHILKVGGIISSNIGNSLKYRIEGETAISGDEIGTFSLDGRAELNLKLWKKDVKLTAHAFAKNNRPSFYYRHFHSEHFWWDDNDLDNELRTRIEGRIEIPAWKTRISAGFENIKNYTYISNEAVSRNDGKSFLNRFGIRQNSGIRVFTAMLEQDFKIWKLYFNTALTYQNSNNQEVLPLPKLNAYANMYIKFKIAKVLNTEIGADVRYFTEYYASDYAPALGQFVQQNPNDKIKIGNYPVASVYANFLLKQTRFYVKYYHANEGTGKRNYFLAPHYPMTPAVLWLGLSWNFYN
ncbi:MAG: putative porin [Bacteroidaceae bacterium]|nr:putative porin [Bacteroidaceae bacterium]